MRFLLALVAIGILGSVLADSCVSQYTPLVEPGNGTGRFVETQAGNQGQQLEDTGRRLGRPGSSRANYRPMQYQTVRQAGPAVQVPAPQPSASINDGRGDGALNSGSLVPGVGFVYENGPNSCPECQPEPQVKLTGFFQLDGGYYHQSGINRLTLGDIDDGLGFRRARLAAKGQVTDDVSFIAEFDFAQNQARFVDVWLQAVTGMGKIRIGRFRQPFGMSELTSVRTLPFLERPLTFAQSPFRQTGIMWFDSRADGRGTWAVSGYRFISDNFGNVFSDAGGYGTASRMTAVLAEWGSNSLFHVGADYTYNTPGRGVLQIASTNEFFVGQNPNLGPPGLGSLPLVGVPPFVNTGLVATDAVQMFNVEAAWVRGNMALQSEGRWVGVDQTGGGTASLPGFYVIWRHVLTGEDIPYQRDQGVLGRIKPAAPVTRNGGLGAWEIAARVSHVDLDDGAIVGRRLTDTTLGCNWYWNNHTKVQFNWIHSILQDATFGTSTANTFAFRAQIDF